VGANGQGLTTQALAQWISQFKDAETTDEQLQQLVNDKVKAKVEECKWMRYLKVSL